MPLERGIAARESSCVSRSEGFPSVDVEVTPYYETISRNQGESRDE
jgi:hypothetical protein